MRASRLKGKTIRKIHQQRYVLGLGGREVLYGLEAIEFTDGTFLRFCTVELEDEYAVDGVYPGKPIAKKRSER